MHKKLKESSEASLVCPPKAILSPAGPRITGRGGKNRRKDTETNQTTSPRPSKTNTTNRLMAKPMHDFNHTQCIAMDHRKYLYYTED